MAKSQKYNTSRITHNDFLDFKAFAKPLKFDFAIENERVLFGSIKSYEIRTENPYIIWFSTSHQNNGIYENYSVTFIDNTKKGPKKKMNFNLQKVYKEPLKISKEKYMDLKSLVDSQLIPQQYTEFYTNLNNTSGNTSYCSQEECEECH
jgi:hypothetical protein